MADIIFVRHGQSKANAEGIIADADAPLTKSGIEQARKTAAEIADFGIKVIVCSPYLRAQQTAETIAGELGVPLADVRVLDNLRERGLGEKEGKHKDQANEWYTQADAPTLETKQALLDRMNIVLNEILQISKIEGTVLIIGHAISSFYLVEAAKGIKLASDIGPDAQVSNAGFVKIEAQE